MFPTLKINFVCTDTLLYWECLLKYMEFTAQLMKLNI